MRFGLWRSCPRAAPKAFGVGCGFESQPTNLADRELVISRLDTLRWCDFHADCDAMETTNAELSQGRCWDTTVRQSVYASRLPLLALLVSVCFHGCSFLLKRPAA